MSDVEQLQEIGLRHGSDKWAGHCYALPYSAHFSAMRSSPLVLLEIGIGGYNVPHEGGHSLRAWKEYFQSSQIIGLDFYDKSELQEERIKTYQGSQIDPVAISNIIKDFSRFDIIIDDGSHRSEHVISTFYTLWQFVKTGGWYVIEDLQTSYWPNHGGKLHETTSPLTTMGFIKSLIDGLNWREIHQPTYIPTSFDTEIASIHFYHNIVFVQKGNNDKQSTEVSANRIGGV